MSYDISKSIFENSKYFTFITKEYRDKVIFMKTISIPDYTFISAKPRSSFC